MSELKRLSQLAFPQAPKDHVFKYIDDEEEPIVVLSDEELLCAIQVMESMNLSLFKFDLVDSPQGANQVVPTTEVQVSKEANCAKSVPQLSTTSNGHPTKLSGRHPLETWLLHNLSGGRKPEVKTPAYRSKSQAPATPYLHHHGYYPVVSDSMWPYNSNALCFNGRVRPSHRAAFSVNPSPSPSPSQHEDYLDVFSVLDAFSNSLIGAEAKRKCTAEKKDTCKMGPAGRSVCARPATAGSRPAQATCTARPHTLKQCSGNPKASSVPPRAYVAAPGTGHFDLIAAVLDQLLVDGSARGQAEKRPQCNQQHHSSEDSSSQKDTNGTTGGNADSFSRSVPTSSRASSPSASVSGGTASPVSRLPEEVVKPTPVFISSEAGAPCADNMPAPPQLGDDHEDDEKEWQVVLEQKPCTLASSPRSPSSPVIDTIAAEAAEA